MTRLVGNGEGNDPADEAFDRAVRGALKEQADARFFGDVQFDERLRAVIRARAAEGAGGPARGGEGDAGTRRWHGRWLYLAAVPAAAAALALALRLSSAPADWKAADRYAGAPAASEAAPAAEVATTVTDTAGSAAKGALAQAERSLGFHVVRPAELPPGATLESVDYEPLWVRQVYRLSGGDTLDITQHDGGLVDRQDPTHPANRGAESVSVNGSAGWLSRSRPASRDAGGSATLVWQQDRFRLSISWSQWDVPADKLLRIAGSVR